METFNSILNEYSINSDVKKRQDIIEKIEENLGGNVLLYVANFQHPMNSIDYMDIRPVEDALISFKPESNIIFIMNSPGGIIDIADKIVRMIKSLKSSKFTFVVPSAAKSAATMIALASDEIIMGEVSELGPIDPQIRIGEQYLSALSYTGILDRIKKWVFVEKQPLDLYKQLLIQIKPEMYEQCQMAMDHSKDLVFNYLKNGALKEKSKEDIDKIVTWLSTLPSHGKVITADDAITNNLFFVKKLGRREPLWAEIWELFCRAEFYMENTKSVKLIQTKESSLAISAGVK